jgi:hypothetical protein
LKLNAAKGHGFARSPQTRRGLRRCRKVTGAERKALKTAYKDAGKAEAAALDHLQGTTPQTPAGVRAALEIFAENFDVWWRPGDVEGFIATLLKSPALPD